MSVTRRGEAPLRIEGKRVLVMGLGTRQGGLGVTRYLVRNGADVTVTDLSSEDALRSSINALAGLPVRYRLGEHRDEDFESADLIVRNPGVPWTSSWLQRARQRGVPIEMEMSLFFRSCPAPIIGITGTKGKTTTASICARILEQMRPDTVLAGNMGTSALDQLERITPETPVVIELSSWQLEGLAEYEMSPDIAVLTNISEDHLNRYASMKDYVEAKRHIARFQRPEDWFVVNRNDQLGWESRETGPARIVPFGELEPGEDGAGVDGDSLYWSRDGERHSLIDASELPLRGRHLVGNALAASAAALLAGASVDQARAGLKAMQAVPHRQEFIATVKGVDYINDTTATAPAAAIAALETYGHRPIVLIAGGSGKGVNLRGFADAAARSASAIVLLDGEETPNLRRLLTQSGALNVSEPHSSMASAVQQAASLSSPGSVVLLAPACASFGMFRDEFDRGEQFRDAVRTLAGSRLGGAA